MRRYALIVCPSFLLVLAGCSTPEKTDEIETPPPHQVHWIRDAEVLNEIEAREIAREALIDKVDMDKIALESAAFHSGPCFEIDFDIPKFCRKGDRIWPVYKSDAGSRKNDSVVLVNAETANTSFIILDNVRSHLVDCEIRGAGSGGRQIAVPLSQR
ncbi:MAG: hypothetical protein JW808_03140 [Victivallales bacterium]|nr:hypothetical protein [Victivallales bacterium]